MPESQQFKSEVMEQLQKLNGRSESLQQSLGEIEKTLQTVTILLTGNGSPEKGIVVRLDRVEVEAERRKVWVKACIASSVGAVFSVVVMLLKAVVLKRS